MDSYFGNESMDSIFWCVSEIFELADIF